MTFGELGLALAPQGTDVLQFLESLRRMSNYDCFRFGAAWDRMPYCENSLANAWDAASAAADLTDRGAQQLAARNAAFHTAQVLWASRYEAGRAVRESAQCVAQALIVRDLIGQHGFTQCNYDLLTFAWRSTIGSVHPEDVRPTP